MYKVYCIECNKLLSKLAYYYGYERCGSCAQKLNNIGNKNGNYKDGRTNKIYYCKDCGKTITDRGRSIRCKSCANKGSRNPAWLNDLSKLGYYKFTKSLKEKIRKRDNRKCQKCNTKEIKLYRTLDVHHIDYDRRNCKENNLISLCSSCNLKANTNRDYWYAYFVYIMENFI